ncbi:MAG: T9SS type A sorting domain-containing protein [Bacteroidetes bacterium]|nr:T9SS type A sorting domain-containing protein [Bacteroidota bacterium]
MISVCHIDGIKFINSSRYAIWYSRGIRDTFQVANCLFTQNSSDLSGAAIFYENANSSNTNSGACKIYNCRFENNSADLYGGAIACAKFPDNAPWYNDFRVSISDCVFSNNSAAFGGAIANMDSTVTLDITRCTFKGNTATVAGGALYDSVLSKTNVYNSLIVGNSAAKSCVWHRMSATPGLIPNKPLNLVHCTIANNKSSSSAASDYAIILNSKDSIRNCIIWDNTTGSGQQINPGPGSNINTNIIQWGGSGSTGTYTFNPLFVSPGSSSAAPFPASASYDYHLMAPSPAIDLGLTNIVAPLGMNTTDLDKNARTYGPAPDLGAYEQSYCTLPNVRINPMSVTICLSSQDSVLLTASGGGGTGTYTWLGRGSIGGGAYKGSSIWAKDSGWYQVMSYDSASGCRGQGSVYVRVVPKMTPVITISGSVLSVPAVYASYQWFKGGVLIAGATSSTYTATSNGRYTIRVSIRAAECQDSASYNLSNLGIGGHTGILEYLSLYPNPAHNGRFNISLDAKQPMKDVGIRISDVTGRQVLSRQYSQPGKSMFEEINLGGASPGIYFVRITADGASFIRRLSVE